MPTDFRNGYSEDNLGFSMMCMVDGLNVVVLWGKFFGGDRNDQVRVRYRFDDRPSPEPTGWTMLSGNELAWMPVHLVDEFVATARASRTLLLSVTDPLDGETIVNSFSLDGFGAAFDRIFPCQ
jgi:hypothetical protein